MFLQDYLNESEYKMLESKYDNEYLSNLDQSNFYVIYNIFIKNNFYYINDIIIKYLHIFTLTPREVTEKLILLKITYGESYVEIIGNNLQILDIFTEQ